jgi:hypothetical protein
MTGGLANLNVNKAAESLVNSSVKDITDQANGALESLNGANLIFSPDI